MTFDLKNASVKEQRAALRALGREAGNDFLVSRPEFSGLMSLLADGEQVLAYGAGVVDAAKRIVVLTDRRVWLLRKPLLGPLQQSSIDLDTVEKLGVENRAFCARLRIEDALGPRVVDNLLKQVAAVFANRMRAALAQYRRAAA